jgi:hypothetical protein
MGGILAVAGSWDPGLRTQLGYHALKRGVDWVVRWGKVVERDDERPPSN